MPSTDVAVHEHGQVATTQAMSINDLIEQVALIQKALGAVMKEGEHYGVIPGTQKPTLYKPGAEKLCLLFRMAPEYKVSEHFTEDEHYSVMVNCVLTHIPTGNRMGAGVGRCSTMESKYRWRTMKRVCPVCGEAAIIKGKAEYGGGWLCWKKEQGCGAKFEDGDPAIEGQESGKMENPDIADTYNTVLKMASKRALVAAVLVTTAASDLFSQDIEDLQSQEITQTASADMVVELRAFVAGLDQELWAEDVICANARQRFGRNIQRFEDLRPSEAEQIARGAETWRLANMPDATTGEIYDPEDKEKE